MKMNWFKRLVEKLGGGEQGKQRAAGNSKHVCGRRLPHGWHTAKRKEHKRQKAARRAQRGK